MAEASRAAKYQAVKITVKELFEGKLTQEPSEKALRDRARQRILVFLETNGAKQLYDRDLSSIRVVAARQCRRPGNKWKDISGVFKELDVSDKINKLIIENLNSGLSKEAIVAKVKSLIEERLTN